MSEERQVILLYFLTDILLCWIAFSIVGFARKGALYDIDFLLVARDQCLCVAAFAVAAFVAGCYNPSRVVYRFDSVYYTIGALAVSSVFVLALITLLPADFRAISRRELTLAPALASLFLGVWRFLAGRFVARFRSFQRSFYVLAGVSDGERIAEAIAANATVEVSAERVTFEELVEKVRAQEEGGSGKSWQTRDAIIALTDLNDESLHKVLAFCEDHCRRTFVYPTMAEALLFQHSNLLALAGIPLVEVASSQPTSPYLRLKRTFDIVAATVGLVLVFPLLIVTAFAIKFSSPGPVLFRQQRLTRGGRVFDILKFRSMVDGGDSGDTEVRAEQNDARVTSVGRFIRRFKIDELPQLLNILRGDMSLVGPRPFWRSFFDDGDVPAFLWERRLAVRSGITSLSHVMGHSFSDPADFLRFDFIYIGNLSLILDMKIVLATLRIVLGGKGGG